MKDADYLIEKVDESAYDDVANILTTAFFNDPLFLWFLRKDRKKENACQNMFKTTLEKYYKPSIVYKDKSSNSSSIWVDSKDLLQASDMSLPMKLRFLFHMVDWCSVSRFNRFLKMLDAQEEHHPTEHHHYLWVIGVRPEAQGQGFGTRMLRHHLNILDQLGVPAYLENSNEINAPLYRRLGFKQINEMKLDENGPYLWGMWREPNS